MPKSRCKLSGSRVAWGMRASRTAHLPQKCADHSNEYRFYIYFAVYLFLNIEELQSVLQLIFSATVVLRRHVPL
jgi:hypothetical protein